MICVFGVYLCVYIVVHMVVTEYSRHRRIVCVDDLCVWCLHRCLHCFVHMVETVYLRHGSIVCIKKRGDVSGYVRNSSVFGRVCGRGI